jgi:hypothetical protein
MGDQFSFKKYQPFRDYLEMTKKFITTDTPKNRFDVTHAAFSDSL